jgi:hypothetical protein
MLTDNQLGCLIIFGPVIVACLLAAVVEARNIYRRETRLTRP